MFEHQARKASRYYEQYKPRLHNEHVVENDAAARHQRTMDEHRQSAEHQRNRLESILQHSNRLRQQMEQGRRTFAQLVALRSVTWEEALQGVKGLHAAMGELTCSLGPPCVAPACAAQMAVLCSVFVPLALLSVTWL